MKQKVKKKATKIVKKDQEVTTEELDKWLEKFKKKYEHALKELAKR